MTTVVKSVEGLIGKTPIFEVVDSLIPTGKKLLLKIEAANPTFSIKDRTALAMMTRAEQAGHLRPGGTIIESTSGNLGKSLAMLGAARGYRIVVVIDPKVSPSIINWYKAFGAEVDVVTVPDATGGYQRPRIARVQELLALNPGAYWPNQYENLDNSEGHAALTGPEILADLHAVGADTLVGSVSTGGHLSGIATHLRREHSAAKIYAADVFGSAIFQKQFSPYLINGLGLSWRAANTKPDVLDGYFLISDQQAVSMCNRLAARHGLLVGGSSGVVTFAAIAALRNDRDTKTVLAVLPDSGVSYLTQYYDEDWRRSHAISIMSEDDLRADLERCTINPIVEEDIECQTLRIAS